MKKIITKAGSLTKKAASKVSNSTKLAAIEVKDRAMSEKNPFWVKMQIAGACIVAVGTLITAAPFALPAGLVAAGTYFITIGGTITGIAQLTKK